MYFFYFHYKCEYGDSMLLQNDGNHQPSYMTLEPTLVQHKVIITLWG
jgi:hypothetical protein